MDAAARINQLVEALRLHGRVDVATAAAEFGTADLPASLGLLPFLTAFVAVGTLLSRAFRDAPQGPAAPARSDDAP